LPGRSLEHVSQALVGQAVAGGRVERESHARPTVEGQEIDGAEALLQPAVAGQDDDEDDAGPGVGANEQPQLVQGRIDAHTTASHRWDRCGFANIHALFLTLHPGLKELPEMGIQSTRRA
jgi:hypothetical protein